MPRTQKKCAAPPSLPRIQFFTNFRHLATSCRGLALKKLPECGFSPSRIAGPDDLPAPPELPKAGFATRQTVSHPESAAQAGCPHQDDSISFRKAAFCGFPRLDRRHARQYPLGALDNRNVDHLAIQRKGSAPCRFGPRIFFNDTHCIGKLARVRGVFLVDDFDLSRMNASRTHEAELPRPAHHRAKCGPVSETCNARDKSKRH